MAHRNHGEALYYHIAGDAITQAEREGEEFRRAQLICTSVIFSALTLEAYINQQYDINVEIRKLDPDKWEIRLKWLALPLLLGCKKTFDKGSYPYQTFDEMIDLRNKLVHFKPTLPYKDVENPSQAFAVIVKDASKARLYFECIPQMIKQLNKLTLGRTEIPRTDFLEGARYIASIYVDVPMGLSTASSWGDSSP